MWTSNTEFEKLRRTWTDTCPIQSLYDTHVAALNGDPEALETMRQFYLALTTLRLTHKV